MAVDPNGRVAKAVHAMAASRAFSKVGPRVMPPLDRFVHRATRGRVLVSRMMLPCIVLTTTGRRSGEPRESPLAAVPYEGDLYVVGSNFGRPHHPAWSWNLLADPTATVSFDGDVYSATAELLSAEEKAATWPLLVAQWPLFDLYVERSRRDLRVFRLVRS